VLLVEPERVGWIGTDAGRGLSFPNDSRWRQRAALHRRDGVSVDRRIEVIPIRLLASSRRNEPEQGTPANGEIESLQDALVGIVVDPGFPHGPSQRLVPEDRSFGDRRLVAFEV